MLHKTKKQRNWKENQKSLPVSMCGTYSLQRKQKQNDNDETWNGKWKTENGTWKKENEKTRDQLKDDEEMSMMFETKI